MSTIKEQIMNYLSEEGLRPQEEEYGIYFRYQMLSFLIHWDEDDANFLKISLPGIFKTDENNRADALEASNVVNIERKVVKAIVFDDNVWLTAEQLLDTTPDFGDIIPRTIGMLTGAREGFYEALRNI